MADRLTSLLTQLVHQSRMTLGSLDLAARSSSFASFLYCSRSGRAGSGRAACGLGNIRISFHCMPGVRTIQAERRFVPSIYMLMGGHCPFRGLDAPLALYPD